MEAVEAPAPAVRIIRPPSDLSMDAAADLKARLVRVIDDHGATLVIDMSGVDHLDTLPLAVIVSARRRADERGARLVVVGLRGQPRELVDEWAPEPPFEEFATVEDASAAS